MLARALLVKEAFSNHDDGALVIRRAQIDAATETGSDLEDSIPKLNSRFIGCGAGGQDRRSQGRCQEIVVAKHG